MHGSIVNRTHALLLLSLAGMLLTSACVELESPPQACRDIADTFATKAAECGEDYDTVYDEFVNSVADGDCDTVVSIRDRDAFYDECIPGIEQMTCPEVESVALPPSCNNQLGQ